ncbi:MAG TPA: DUF4349 domain-containing protein [Candidatus Limnocylindrales bacterium]|nr:DUF4349 domain-containing protein [Candidatus Limnocylindrales bacterium]
MGDFLGRRPILSLAALIGGLVLVIGFLIVEGSHQPQILSTVGAAVGPPTDGSNDGSSTDGSDADGPATPGLGSAPSGGPQVADANAAALAPAPGLLIVHTGTLAIRVPAIPAAIDRISAVVGDAGGFVATSKATGNGAEASATLEVRIPAAAWDPALTTLRGLGTVLDQEIGSDEVTGQVVDLDARVANLRATEAALQAIMAKAAKIDDILAVQEQLTDTRGQIEELVAKAAALRDAAAFGSLTLTLSVPAPAATPTPVASRPPLWDPGRDAELAGGKLVRIGQVGTTAAIWLAIVGIPIVLSLAIGLGILRLAWLGARRAGLVGGREPG